MSKYNKGQQTKDKILRQAHRLFIKQGYHGTSMRQIAEKTGIALSGIYNHFSSKAEIFEEVFLTYHPYNDVLPALEGAQGATLEELVRNAAYKMVQALNKRPDFLNLMFIEYMEFKNKHTKALVDDVIPKSTMLIQRFTSPRDRLRPISVPVLIRAFVSMFLGYYLTEMMLRGWSDSAFSDQSLEDFIAIFLHGVVADNQGA